MKDTITDIAVIGMECVFPKAGNVGQYWKNITQSVDAITELPPSRFDPTYYDPSANRIDRLYCKRGGHVDDFAQFDPAKYGIMPNSAKYAEPDQLLTLRVAHEVLEHIGYFKNSENKNGKTGIILGKGNYIGTGTVKLLDAIRTTEHIRIILKKTVPSISDTDIEKICEEFQGQCNYASADNAIGLISNLVVSRIANRFDFHGPAYTIDAACASSLVAVDNAVQELISGRCDTILTGGVQINHDACFWSVFTQLKALSRNQQIRPYDRRADGVLIGEGVGIVALKRLADAQKNGDTIYAVIKGVGVSSDGKAASAVSPDTKGQLRAIKEAWDKSGLDPDDIGYLEGHGTATNAGDTTELTTLEKFFGKASSKKRAGLGSVKSMIGHTMPAAGVAGLIKTVMALHTNILPPTIHCEEPNELVDETRFSLVTEPKNWKQSGLLPIAGVNAFGFGGINGHVVLKAYQPNKGYRSKNGVSSQTWSFSNAATKDEKILILSAKSKESLLNALEEKSYINEKGLYKLIIFNPNTIKIEKAIKIIQKNISWHGKQDIWYSFEGLIEMGGKIAFVFPGIDSSFNPNFEDLFSFFRFEKRQNMYPKNIVETAIAVIEINKILDRILKSVGVIPDHIAGHSIGEWSGMLSSEMVSEDFLHEIIENIDFGSFELPDVQFIAAGCGIQKAEEHMRGLNNIALSHDNCLHQTILCGKKASIDSIKHCFLKDNIFCQILPFQSGFHSPFFKDFIKPFENTAKNVTFNPSKTPMWSCTTGKIYPENLAQLRKLIVTHLIQPINFTEITKALYEQGVKVFIQVGFGSLTNFIDDTLKGKQKLTLQSNVANRTGMQQLSRLISALYVEGADIDLSKIGIDYNPDKKNIGTITTSQVNGKTRRSEISLELGAPIIRDFSSRVSGTIRNKSIPKRHNPMANIFEQTLFDINANQNEVLDLFITKSSHSVQTGKSVEAQKADKRSNGYKQFTVQKTFSFDNYPELYDHCLIQQKKGWHDIADTFPVVPMTMTLQVFIDIAEEFASGKKVITIENIQALRWIKTSNETRTIEGKYISDSTIHMEIKGHFLADLIVSDSYPKAPSPSAEELKNPCPSPVAIEKFYSDRWMFHGPDYQGVHSLDVIGDNGIFGSITVTPGKGALLDNAGQIFSFGITIKGTKNRIAIPSKIKRIEFFHDHPKTGEIIECKSRTQQIDDNYVSSDIELTKDNSLWSRITEWKDIRFVTDDTFWSVIRHPERNRLSTEISPHVFVFNNIFYNTISRDNIVYRYLNRKEREHRQKIGLRGQAHYLNGRIAAKDAIRHFVLEKHKKELFPIEVTIENKPSGQPVVMSHEFDNLMLSIAHKDNWGVAILGENKGVGIDIEKIESRSRGFETISFHQTELNLIPQGDKDQWITKFWSAKEAYGKYLGIGMNNNPKQFTISKIIDENKIIIEDKEVKTDRMDDYIVAWIE